MKPFNLSSQPAGTYHGRVFSPFLCNSSLGITIYMQGVITTQLTSYQVEAYQIVSSIISHQAVFQHHISFVRRWHITLVSLTRFAGTSCCSNVSRVLTSPPANTISTWYWWTGLWLMYYCDAETVIPSALFSVVNKHLECLPAFLVRESQIEFAYLVSDWHFDSAGRECTLQRES